MTEMYTLPVFKQVFVSSIFYNDTYDFIIHSEKLHLYD